MVILIVLDAFLFLKVLRGDLVNFKMTRKVNQRSWIQLGFAHALLVIVCCILTEPVSTQTPQANKNTLVLVDNLAIKETHSTFFRRLQGNYLNF